MTLLSLDTVVNCRPSKKPKFLSHICFKLKRDDNINGRVVAGRNKQRDFISKDEASSPTVATKAVLLSCVIDAQEHRYVAKIDIPNASIQTRVKKIKDMATIIVQRSLLHVLVEIATYIYGPYIRTYKKGFKTLIRRCHNAIYGTMVVSPLYYRKFCKMIKNLGSRSTHMIHLSPTVLLTTTR